jgi:hypothetical protein
MAPWPRPSKLKKALVDANSAIAQRMESGYAAAEELGNQYIQHAVLNAVQSSILVIILLFVIISPLVIIPSRSSCFGFRNVRMNLQLTERQPA